ncbi:MAG: RluA family pseudouridine synthase [Eubacteriales bacterium]|nr:RluA family pseudouridine synthase [Eubacteriales bacterium]
MRKLIYKINVNTFPCTVLQFMRSQGFSKQILVSMKPFPDAILRNDKHPFMDDSLVPGDTLIITLPKETPSEKIIPYDYPLDVIFEDEDILVVNKPSGMPVHPSQGHYEHTLANAVCHHMQIKKENYVFRCINRLDRDTSGILVIAKNALSSAVLYNQMRCRRIKRTYLALAEGTTPLKGSISAPIARVDASTIMREVNFDHGEDAITHYERLSENNGLSLLELHLETGRTHQIRVHMKHIGNPLPGDFLYNPNYDRIKRQPLHSYQLEFEHPILHHQMLFTAPVPEDMYQAFID